MDPGGFGQIILYIRVAQQRLGGGLFISIEFNFANVIVKKHGVSSRYIYPCPFMVWDPGICRLLEDKQSLGSEDL